MVIFECVISLTSAFPSATVRFIELWQTAVLRLEETCGCFVSMWMNMGISEMALSQGGASAWRITEYMKWYCKLFLLFGGSTTRRPVLWKADITAFGLQPFPDFWEMSVLAIEKTTAFLHLCMVLLLLHNKIWNMILAGLISESCFMCFAGKLVLVILLPEKLCRVKTLGRNW